MITPIGIQNIEYIFYVTDDHLLKKRTINFWLKVSQEIALLLKVNLDKSKVQIYFKF